MLIETRPTPVSNPNASTAEPKGGSPKPLADATRIHMPMTASGQATHSL
jgi:hypothetical protein